MIIPKNADSVDYTAIKSLWLWTGLRPNVNCCPLIYVQRETRTITSDWVVFGVTFPFRHRFTKE